MKTKVEFELKSTNQVSVLILSLLVELENLTCGEITGCTVREVEE